MVELDLEKINSLSPYPIERVGVGKYIFTSTYDIDFFIEFMPDENLKSDESYQFILVNLKHKPSPKDPKVRNTVFEILKNFLISTTIQSYTSAILEMAASFKEIDYSLTGFTHPIMVKD